MVWDTLYMLTAGKDANERGLSCHFHRFHSEYGPSMILNIAWSAKVANDQGGCD